ncbi:MAG: hypothetical protein JRF64_10285 [Deltaproteobacteria bacterium]|nr:hypothetical protein [Deltaproteobacteria bacterium]
MKPSRHVSAFDLSLLADNRNAADGLFTKPSKFYFENVVGSTYAFGLFKAAEGSP